MVRLEAVYTAATERTSGIHSFRKPLMLEAVLVALVFVGLEHR
jgi:hypothetical protein